MSTIRDSIIAAVSDGARTTSEIAAATGFEVRQISNNIYPLKAEGLIMGTPEGLVIGPGKPATATKTRTHLVAKVDEPDREAALIESGFRSARQKQQAAKINGAAHKLPEAQPEPARAAVADTAAVKSSFAGEVREGAATKVRLKGSPEPSSVEEQRELSNLGTRDRRESAARIRPGGIGASSSLAAPQDLCPLGDKRNERSELKCAPGSNAGASLPLQQTARDSRERPAPITAPDQLIVANLGEYVVLRRADLAELLGAVEIIGRWRDLVEAG
jgi:hypothetical protein